MTIPNQLVPTHSPADPNGPRAATVRVLTNALLVLVAFEVVSIVGGVGLMLVRGETSPAPPAELVPVMAGFLLVRWIFVLPVMLPALVGLDYICRRVPQLRVLIAMVAFAPMILWELMNGPGGLSSQGAILGVTAVLFALVARRPSQIHGRPADEPRAPQPRVEPATRG